MYAIAFRPSFKKGMIVAALFRLAGKIIADPVCMDMAISGDNGPKSICDPGYFRKVCV